MMTPSIRFALIIGSSVISLAIAVTARGGPTAFFSHSALTALAIVLAVLSVAALFAGGNLSPGEQEDRGNRWVLTAFALLTLLIICLPPLADRRDFWTFGGAATRWSGVTLFAAGGALRLWPVVVLGDRFSGLVAIQKGHTLVTTGIYRLIRHPSYLGMIVSTLGWALAFRSAIGVLLTASLLIPLIARMQAEERLLSGQFGDQYVAYRARTYRLIPGLY